MRIVRIVRISVGCRRVARRRWRVPLRQELALPLRLEALPAGGYGANEVESTHPAPSKRADGSEATGIISRLEGSFLSITDVAIDKLPHPFKVSIAIHLVMRSKYLE